ncbi:MAG: DUF192 domain-containing protein [Candidatus Micrarchaeia archaeon]
MDSKKAAGKNPRSASPACTLSNISRKKSVRIPLEIADNELSRTRGLMFRRKVVPILFVFSQEGIYPIHSFFVPGLFDAIYLSGDGKVAEAFFRIPPGKPLICPKRRAKFLLELPPQISRRLGIRAGDRIGWKWAHKTGGKREIG